MKKKIISAVLAVTLAMTFSIPVHATPSEEVLKNQAKYEEFTTKLNNLTEQIMELNAEIEPLVEKIEINEVEMNEIKVEVENTEKEIESAEENIIETEALLAKRVRELYKSGGQSSYLMLLFSANSFNDLLVKLESTNRLVNIDKEIMYELEALQTELDNKVKSLEEREATLEKINK